MFIKTCGILFYYWYYTNKYKKVIHIIQRTNIKYLDAKLQHVKEKRLSENDIAKIVQLRGLGYNQAEIAEELGVSQSAIQYQLNRIKKRAKDKGDDETFWTLLVGAGVGLGAGLLIAKLLEKK